eukprot:TRINITY_DN50660_c0_g1_i1.p1 TRINITY_DN50660_c0_g1~~TRINITY_DN50660_c0_g1_i1.p1  ORF type:complete len:284 (-),score=21.39 TRINITY_DN50660_c0_g1_i1:128-979(-)
METTSPGRKLKNPVPGPGTYELPGAFAGVFPSSTLKSTQTYSIPSGRTEPVGRQDKGGPAQFFPTLDASTRMSPGARGFSFGGARRELSNTSKARVTPGPENGQRDGSDKFGRTPNYGFGSTQRTFVIPGKFAEKEGNAVKGFKTPGPGTHDPEYEGTSGRRKIVSYPVQQRREPLITPRKAAFASFTGKAMQASPGPGQYSPTAGLAEPIGGDASRAFRIPAARVAELRVTPGPTDYDVRINNEGHPGICTDGAAPKWTMPTRDDRSEPFQGLDPAVAHKLV